MKGFSPRNLKYMRAFAEAWPDEPFVQAVLAQITWYHNLAILEKLADADDRIWYAKATIQHGWSRNVLVHQIEARRRHRQGKAVTNFDRTLPSPQSDLAQDITKDPYNFDFLTLGDDAHERDLERGLLDHLRPISARTRRRVRVCGKPVPTYGRQRGILHRSSLLIT